MQSEQESGEEEERVFSKDPSEVLQPKKPVWHDEDDDEIRYPTRHVTGT